MLSRQPRRISYPLRSRDWILSGRAVTPHWGSISDADSATTSALLRPMCLSRNSTHLLRLLSSTVSKSATDMSRNPASTRFLTVSFPRAPAPATRTLAEWILPMSIHPVRSIRSKRVSPVNINTGLKTE